METELDYIMFMRKHDVLEHGQRVAVVVNNIGKELKLTNKQIQDLEICSLLHDIGKTKIDPHILDKKVRLTDNEFNIVKKHSIYSYEILNSYDKFRKYSNIVLYHHENYDGSGYPVGLKGEDIPLFSRIIRIADVFDALCSDRAYRKACTIEAAVHIMNNQFVGKFDPMIYKSFLDMLNKKCANF